MRKIAVLEKTKTPYRPPLFDYIGSKVNLTVIYIGKTPSHRQWDAEHQPENYSEVWFDGVDIGPITLTPKIVPYLIRNDYDEVYIASEINMILNSLIASIISKLKGWDITVWTEFVHTPWLMGEGRPLKYRIAKKCIEPIVQRLQSHLYRRANRVIAYSELAEKTAIKSGAEEAKVTVAPPWYPPSILPDLAANQPHNKNYRVLFLGVLNKRKGVDTLLKAAQLYNANDGIEFAIAGDGPLSDKVSQRAKSYEHIIELGYISGERKGEELAAADLLVLPSRHDAWGQVVNEAYIAGTPVVTTSSAGSEMIVPYELTVPPEDPEALARAINRARANPPENLLQPSRKQMAEPLISSSKLSK